MNYLPLLISLTLVACGGSSSDEPVVPISVNKATESAGEVGDVAIGDLSDSIDNVADGAMYRRAIETAENVENVLMDAKDTIDDALVEAERAIEN